MKAAVLYDFSEADRRNIARFLGFHGLASHIQCTAWAREQLRATLAVLAQVQPRPADPLAPLITRNGDH